MRTIISYLVASVLAVFSLVGSIAFAEDSKAYNTVDMAKTKVGAQKIDMTYERLADGTTWESVITCTKVSQNIVKCVATDELGWVETIRCENGKCKTVAKR